MLAAARTLGHRAILARGWAGLDLDEAARDCLVIGEVDQQALFQRVAAVVRHSGAGTTTTAAAAGAPRLVVPQRFDQFHFAGRVDRPKIGTAHVAGYPTADSLIAALRRVLDSQVSKTSHPLADRVRTDGD
ncbi:glycosyltransferase [Streptomyces olivochromogenes]|uniref:glycosyltransferase n=1 Tax=Streptomyces olivochromogenes TaxID=1963 RepID=UPI0036D9B9B6